MKQVLLCLLFLAVSPLAAQQNTPQKAKEQTNFGIDEPFDHPVSLNREVRLALAKDQGIADRLKDGETAAEDMPGEWFEIAEIHLGDAEQPDLLVKGVDGFLGASVAPFWVLRRTAHGYHVVLSTGGLGLQIMATRRNGLKVIRTGVATAAVYSQSDFAFDGHKYRLSATYSGPIDEEPPKNLSRLKTRPPLEQAATESPDSVLAAARDWLWTQWQLERPSYLKVTLAPQEGERTTTTYYLVKDAEQLEVMIQIHRRKVDREAGLGFSWPVTQDELWIANDIERRLVPSGDSSRNTQVPKGEQLPSASYKLLFSDEAGNEIAVL